MVREMGVDLLFISEQYHQSPPDGSWHYDSTNTAAIWVAIALYASTVWGGAFISSINLFETIQNKAIRLITGAPKYAPLDKCREELGLPSIMDYIRELATNFYERSKNSQSELISNLCIYPYNPHLNYRRPRDFLYDNTVHGAYRKQRSSKKPNKTVKPTQEQESLGSH